ncbi:MAG: Gfo/Idh/MocA family oxidoreductase [Pirellulales bacterium]|nr:Gfo/Idh/MocA family oxidoreductase [Pirellulales bacterium]
MPQHQSSRRRFLGSTAAGLASAAALPFALPPVQTGSAELPAKAKSRNLRIGCIGMRYQGSVIALKAQEYGTIVAICDVDRHVREQARASFGSTPAIYEDYRDLLNHADIDVVTIGAPDHWHTPMTIAACRAGKDVYVEKPLTLTIDEGKGLRDVVRETGRIVQVGSWQRSDGRFRLAVEMVRQGRIGKLRRVDVILGKNPAGGPFQVDDPPPELNWDLWLGPAPMVPYMHERCHYTFRWWYDTAGGQMTDWGAHHIDIAQWAIGDCPREVQTKAKMPNIPNGYSVPIDYYAEYVYPNEILMTVSDHGRTGILFTGDAGRIFVNRGTIAGQPVDALQEKPLSREAYQLDPHENLDRPLRFGKLDAIVNHMGNFFDCVQSRHQPISDVKSQHRSATTCHLGNISMRLDRPLKWDPMAERFVDDDEANGMLSRIPRAGYEVS